MNKRITDNLSDADFGALVQRCFTVDEVAKAIGYSSGRTSKGKVTARIERQNLCVKHFRNWIQFGLVPTAELLVRNSSVNNQTIKKRVLADGLLKNECIECGNPGVHNGKPLVLHMDHTDGDN